MHVVILYVVYMCVPKLLIVPENSLVLFCLSIYSLTYTMTGYAISYRCATDYNDQSIFRLEQ